MYPRPRCDVILWVIYQTSALNQVHHAHFTRSIVGPRYLAVFFPPFLFPRSSDFRRVAPLHCSLQGKHVDLVASTEGVKHFIRAIKKMPPLYRVLFASLFLLHLLITYTYAPPPAHTHATFMCTQSL